MKLAGSVIGRTGVVLDTMLFIYLFEDIAPYAAQCQFLVEQMKKGAFTGLVTPVTAAELVVKPLQKRRVDIADRYRHALHSMENLAIGRFDVELGFIAGSLKAEYRLPFPDMFQVASAMVSSTPTLITNDKDLKRVKEVDVYLIGDVVR